MPISLHWKSALWVALALGGLYLGLIVVGAYFQRDIIWPMSVEEEVDRPVPPDAEVVWKPVAGEEGDGVEAWFFPAHTTGDAPAPAVMFFHGNNEVMDHCLEFAERYPANGMAVLLVEYRGYGRSNGRPSMENVGEDMRFFYDWLASRPEVDPQRIFFHGRSIGGAVAAELATARPPAALVLQATFTSMAAMFQRYGVPGFIVADPYDTEAVLASADFPVLVLHGSRDNIIPVNHGRQLGKSGRRTTYREYDANHDLPVD